MFSSYEDLKKHVEEFERENFIQLAHGDSRMLPATAKRAPKVMKKANKDLLYYTTVLTCVFGGKKHKNEGTGARPRQRFVILQFSLC